MSVIAIGFLVSAVFYAGYWRGRRVESEAQKSQIKELCSQLGKKLAEDGQ